MSIKKVFKNHIASCKYIFKNGKEASFIGGMYLTDIDSEVAELQAEVKAGHPHIHVDAAMLEIEEKFLDPIEQIKAKAIAEYLAAQEVALTPSDLGKTEQGKLQGIASSKTVAALAAGSSATATAVKV